MSNKINPNDPAMPIGIPEDLFKVNTGLSIRAELAARAMQGLLSSQNYMDWLDSYEDMAKNAVKFADALINELNKEV